VRFTPSADGDVFGSMRCDCGPQLETALAKVAAEGAGVVVYLRGHEGPRHRTRTQDPRVRLRGGRDTVDANLELGLRSTRASTASAHRSSSTSRHLDAVMTNNPSKYGGLDGLRLEYRRTRAAREQPYGVQHRLSTNEAKRLVTAGRTR